MPTPDETPEPPQDSAPDPGADAPTPFERWYSALEARHLAQLTFPEVRRALEALSAVYVERRDKLGRGADLDGAGKRAAFALFYAPLHFATAQLICEQLALPALARSRVVDLGAGTGVVGAAAALACGGKVAIDAVDRSAWALGEARWNWEHFGLDGRTRPGDLLRHRFAPEGALVTLGWTVNELDDAGRASLFTSIDKWHRAGAAILVLEPIARRMSPWWDGWRESFALRGGTSREWRFPAELPERLRLLYKAAGMDHRELTARSLFLPPAGA